MPAAFCVHDGVTFVPISTVILQWFNANSQVGGFEREITRLLVSTRFMSEDDEDDGRE
jgi:hypothetical protein